jgi:hypothetical protein
MSDLALTGLDGQNPLAFFAALGLLRVLDERIPATKPRPRLFFIDDGRQTAHLQTKLSFDEVCGLVLEDAAGRYGAAALTLAYDKEGQLVSADGEDAIADLKPSREAAAAFLESLHGMDRRSADLGAAFFSELGQDNNGNTKPTALHFTAGQQKFLEMVSELRTSLQLAHLEEALRGPWRGLDPLPSLSWDSTVARLYALRAVNPSSEKRGSVAGANWLAVIGLSYFPVNVRKGRLVTTGVVGGWKDSVFHWPVWSAPCTRLEVASLLRGDITRLRRHEREAMGVTQVFRAAITRSDQGGYGAFSPAEAVLPRGPSGGERTFDTPSSR